MKPELLEACLLGGALGDSIGLPSEGIGARRIAKLRRQPMRHCLVGCHGMVSDDTEHAVMTLLSLHEADGDPERFAKILARRLRWWLASVPAGIGFATARSILRLWFGINPARSGVWSAGNGPLMRAPVIGLWFAKNEALRNRFVDASTMMTHRDPRAVEGARLIAAAAAILAREDESTETDRILDELERWITSDEMRHRLPLIRRMLLEGGTVESFADSITRKPGFVTGFAPDSAAVAIYAWLHHRNDFRGAIEAVILAGGDTDTIAFITGSLAGIDCGTDGFPEDWMRGLRDWPIHPRSIRNISNGGSMRFPVWPLSLVRNLAFLAIVLCHGFRRLLPPH